MLKSLFWVMALGVTLRSYSAPPIDADTRIAEVMNAPALDAFAKGFVHLSENERGELLALLSTEMLGWEGLEHLPPQTGERVLPARKQSLEGLKAWIQDNPIEMPALSNLRFVQLIERPAVKLKFEKGKCVPERLDAADRLYLKALAWWARVTRWPVLIEKPTSCQREVRVSLAVESDQTGLREQSVVKTRTDQLLSFLQGSRWPQFRRKTWEGLEILLSDLRGETAQVPQRLRVVELVEISREAFLLRRQTALRLQAHGAIIQGR